jgi:hypothetical protein
LSTQITTIEEARALPLGTVLRQALTVDRGNWAPDLFGVYVKDSYGWDDHIWQKAGVDGWTTLDEREFPLDVIALPVVMEAEALPGNCNE